MKGDLSVLSREDMQALIESAAELNTRVTLDELLQGILTRAGQLTDSPDTTVILRHKGRAGLYAAAATGDKADWLLATFGRQALKEIPLEGSKAGKVFTTGKPMFENKVEGHFKGVDEETEKVTQSMVCVPLGEGADALGVMQILNKRGGDYTERDIVLLGQFAQLAAVALKNARLFESMLAHSGFHGQAAETPRLFELMHELEKPAHTERLTVLFADLRGFTQLCQSLTSPVELQEHLNEFITMLTDTVCAHDGVVNQFLGDGLMALFRGEDHAVRAVKAAFAIVERFEKMTPAWNETSSVQLSFLDVGIGIATGDATIGGIGSDNVRNFTAIGSTVNLAAALEHQARDGRRILTNHLTYQAVKDRVVAEPLEDFVLQKPGQTVGIGHKRYLLRKFARPAEYRLFVSHNHRDREWVEEKIVRPLQALGIRTWYSATDIPKGALWPAEIRRGLRDCECMIVVVSKNSGGSEWVRLEVDLAISLGKMKGRIIPLKIDGTPAHTVNEFLMAVQGINAKTSPNLAQEIADFVRNAAQDAAAEAKSDPAA